MKKLIALILSLIMTFSICGCSVSINSASKTTQQSEYSQTAINSAKKAIQYIDEYISGSINAEKAEKELESLEDNLDSYISENQDLTTTENDKWINGKIDLAKYSIITDNIPNITKYRTELEEMIK